MNKEMVTKENLILDFKKLGVKRGDLLNIKCSMRSIGKINGGARTLIDALLETVGPEGTIITDSFIDVYRERIARKKPISSNTCPSYAGVLANEMIKYPLAYRSKHPIQKFVAIGTLAKELMNNHTPESYGYDVLRVMCKIGGKNLKIGTDDKVVGVGTTHVAIGLLGFKQLRQVAGVFYENDYGKRIFFERDWAGICSDGLIKFVPYYEEAGAVISKGKIGNADAKITDMKKTLEVELKLLKQDPTFFMCKNEDCVDCQLTWEFSTGKRFNLLFKYLLKGKMGKVARVLSMIFFKYHIYPQKKISL